jgi:type IV pilus assembly protein PilY1
MEAPAPMPFGTLAVTINVPTNVKCDPGGSSWLVTVNAANGGAIAKQLGSDADHWSSISFLGYALASRPEIVTTADGKRDVIRMSDQTFRSPNIPEPPVPATKWRRV